MKRTLTLIFTAFAILFATASDSTPQESYIAKYSGIAVKEMRRTGVPASITLAQGMLESRYGLSKLAVEGHNHFGIKCHSDWKGKKMYHDDDASQECFRVYASDAQSFRDHSDFLRYRDRYKPLFELAPTDYKGWARGLKEAGYATDPKYADKLIKIIEDYNLHRFDIGSAGEKVSVPEAPLLIEKKSEHRVVKGEHYSYSLSRPLYKRNGVRFVYSQPGETYSSIAGAYNLFLKEILRFNDLSAEQVLEKGSVVYLQRKKRFASPGMEMYVFSEGENLRDVCQRFAVQEKSIIKLNELPDGYVPQEGDKIMLRKLK
ncbi:MAG TPA: glucosaminidase domain-containing protein [Candidatus Cryptobacteroides sp.]|jgi:hypothetical protein|nr:glucosaminidase domain-containing protein [Candidatus Cryptobacteroides sp.]